METPHVWMLFVATLIAGWVGALAVSQRRACRITGFVLMHVGVALIFAAFLW